MLPRSRRKKVRKSRISQIDGVGAIPTACPLISITIDNGDWPSEAERGKSGSLSMAR